ncbi:MAG: exosporium morphogenetic protein CdeC [Paraclostridium sp.]
MNDLMRAKKVVSKRVLKTPQNQSQANKNNRAMNQLEEELDRACNKHKDTHNSCNHEQHHSEKCEKHKPEYSCSCDCYCDDCCCNNHHCECEQDDCTDNCFQNPCGDECAYPLQPAKFTTCQATMYPIETNRVYDTIMFRVFTDGKSSDGSDLEFKYSLVDLKGPLPVSPQTNVTIEKVCINYGSIKVCPGITSLEDLVIEEVDCGNDVCKSVFEYNVCGQINKCCNEKCMGQNIAFKEKGLKVLVSDLEIELTGKFGCSEFTAIATPKYGTHKHNCVAFFFNTLSGDIVVPANGNSFRLREVFKTQLTVDCIGKGIITQTSSNNQTCYQLCIPNGIDLVCCLQNVVSVLMEEQIVVLGGPTVIEPRLVDTFGSVCDFSQFGTKMEH